MTVPSRPPSPPVNAVPPISTAAITVSSRFGSTCGPAAVSRPVCTIARQAGRQARDRVDGDQHGLTLIPVEPGRLGVGADGVDAAAERRVAQHERTDQVQRPAEQEHGRDRPDRPVDQRRDLVEARVGEERDRVAARREKRDALVDRERPERDDEERDLEDADHEAVRRARTRGRSRARRGSRATTSRRRWTTSPRIIAGRGRRGDREVDAAGEDDEGHPDPEGEHDGLRADDVLPVLPGEEHRLGERQVDEDHGEAEQHARVAPEREPPERAQVAQARPTARGSRPRSSCDAPRRPRRRTRRARSPPR